MDKYGLTSVVAKRKGLLASPGNAGYVIFFFIIHYTKQQ